MESVATMGSKRRLLGLSVLCIVVFNVLRFQARIYVDVDEDEAYYNLDDALGINKPTDENQDKIGSNQKDENDIVKKTITGSIFSWETSLTAKHATTYVPKLLIVRPIGNSLPPRHDKEQTVWNLKFILDHEPHQSNLQRHWFVNRIVDEEVETRILDLLHAHNESYTRIPFNLSEYASVPYVYSIHASNAVDPIHARGFRLRNKFAQKRIIDAIQNEKILYVANINVARNEMIEYGKRETDVDYILPFDGHCFLSNASFHSIQRAIAKSMSTSKQAKYFHTPLDRVKTSNDVLLNASYVPHATYESQIIFHRSAQARFHPRLRYGHMDKPELLIRMNVPGPWHEWLHWESWEHKLFLNQSHIVDLEPSIGVSVAGWVPRLSAGTTEDDSIREHARSTGMALLLQQLDSRVATELYGWSRHTYMYYDRDILRQEREKAQTSPNGAIGLVLQDLVERADKAMTRGSQSVMGKDKRECRVSGDCHDYYTEKWGTNNPSSYYVARKSDRSRAISFRSNTAILGLAYALTGNQSYAVKAAKHIRSWFVNPETQMTPSLRYAGTAWNNDTQTYNGTYSGVMEWKDLYYFLDTVRMIEESGELTSHDQDTLHDWFSRYLEYLLSSDQGADAYIANGIHGLYYDIQVAAVASYVGHDSVAIQTLHHTASRLERHISSHDGSIEAPVAATCESYQLWILQAWTTMARMARRVGVDLWECSLNLGNEIERLSRTNRSQSALCRASESTIPFFSDRDVCTGNRRRVDHTRWWPLWMEARSNCPHLKNRPLVTTTWLDSDSVPPPTRVHGMPSMFDSDSGIAPFWNLGLTKLRTRAFKL